MVQRGEKNAISRKWCHVALGYWVEIGSNGVGIEEERRVGNMAIARVVKRTKCEYIIYFKLKFNKVKF